MGSKSFSLVLNHQIQSFNKSIKVDSDKSLSIRSFLIGAISQDISKAKNILESEDIFSTINCLKKLGVFIKKIKPGTYHIHGKGLGSLFAKNKLKLNFGNSGTLARLLTGILSTTPDIEVIIQGDKSLNNRNMEKLIDLLSSFGALFYPKNKKKFPLKLISTEMPIGIKYKAGVSAQLKSAAILAGLNSYGITEIIEEKKSRDHTENMLENNTGVVRIDRKEYKKQISIIGKKSLKAFNINIPGDPSSAAFFTALTIMSKNSSLIIKNVGLNPTRIGFYDLLKKHGANIKFINKKKRNNEFIGDIKIKSGKLKRPINCKKIFYERTTDEFPILFCIAALTNGVSTFNGIGDLVNKESNRIKEMQKVLKQAGVKSISNKNQMKIYGKKTIENKNKSIYVPNLNDHRICMSTTIFALITGIKTKIKNFETVNTSSPNFLKIIKSMGAKFEYSK